MQRDSYRDVRSSASMAPNFLTGEELDRAGLSSLLDRAEELKRGRAEGVGGDALAGRSVGLLFERPSTRTRISFEVGVFELGGHPVVLRGDELQLSRGESAGRHGAGDVALPVGDRDPLGLRRGGGGAGRGGRRPGRQRADARPPPLPGARRHADAARALRRARGPSPRLRRRRQQLRPLAGDPGRHRGGRGGRRGARRATGWRTASASRPATPPRRPRAPTRSTPTSGSAWATSPRASAAWRISRPSS